METESEVNKPANVTINDEDPERFKLFLDWVYPGVARQYDWQTLDQVLSLCDRYMCAGLRESLGQLVRLLPPSFELLKLLGKHGLNLDTFCKTAVWAMQQNDLIMLRNTPL